MKLPSLFGFFLPIALLLTGCSTPSTGQGESKIVNHPSALVTANTQFGLDLYRQLKPAAEANFFFSPFSVSTALAMTSAGARGETAGQMAGVLHLSNISTTEVAPAFGELQKHLNELQSQGPLQLAVANALWAGQNPEHPFLPAYLDLVRNDFAAEVFPQDFRNNAPRVRRSSMPGLPKRPMAKSRI